MKFQKKVVSRRGEQGVRVDVNEDVKFFCENSKKKIGGGEGGGDGGG